MRFGKNKIAKISIILCILGIILLIHACGGGIYIPRNALEKAYNELYKNDFSYTNTYIVETSSGKEEGTYTGKVQASPYIQYLDYSEVSSVTPEIYYYGNLRVIKAKIKTEKGTWNEQIASRPYFDGYHEHLDILSEEEATIDGISCTKYTAQYTKRKRKLNVTVPLEVYLDNSTGQIKRIIVDETDSEKKNGIANLMSTQGMSEEEAKKEVEKDWDKNRSSKYIIDITYEEVTLSVP